MLLLDTRVSVNVQVGYRTGEFIDSSSRWQSYSGIIYRCGGGGITAGEEVSELMQN